MSLLEVVNQQGIVTLTLNDPDRRNLLSGELCRGLIEHVNAAAENPEARAIVIRGKGKAFCAGADLDDLKAAARGDTAAVESVYEAFMCVADSPLPTVAVVQGPAVGAGMNLALACDIRIAGERARFDTRFLQIGLHPGGGHAWMLLRAVGWQVATQLLLLGETLDASGAERVGLVARSLSADELEQGLAALFGNVASLPRELLLRTKQSMRMALNQRHGEALQHETIQQMWSLQQPAFTDLVTRLQHSLGTP